LDLAIASGSLDSVRALLENGADARRQLWPALRSGNEPMTELVLLYGANVKEIDSEGGLPLEYSLRNRWLRTSAMLMEKGADPNPERDKKEPWLAAAIRENDTEVAHVLLDNGARVEGVVDKNGHSLLGWAIAHKNREMVERLIEGGADVRAREKAPAADEFKAKFERSKTFRWHLQADSRITPLMMGAAQGELEIVKSLMAAGARASEYSRRYLWPVNIAAWHMDVPMMQVILGRDPDPDNQPRKVVVNLSKQKAYLYKDGKQVFSTRISTGKPGYRTPTGNYVISDKHRHHNSTIYGSSMPYYMRLSCAAFGLHQGYVPNYPASHGCIRVPYSGAKHLFYTCEVGDRVEITY
jgi:ankyrin repeat protein